MKLHKIKRAAPDDLAAYSLKMWIEFDDDPKAVVDLAETSPWAACLTRCAIASGLRRSRSPMMGARLLWRTGPAVEDIVDLCADALWLMAHPEDRAKAMAAP